MKSKTLALNLVSLIAMIVVLLPISAFAATGLTYHGRIIKPNGQPLEGASVFFHLQLRSPGAENCLLYDEQQTLNMTGSKGLFVITIGDGVRAAPAVDGGYPIDKVFANRGMLTGLTCNLGNSYSPGFADGRKLQVQFNDGSGWETLNPSAINYVPLAIEATQIGGYKKDQLLRVADGVVATEFSNANWTELWALITGTSSVYSKADGSNFNPSADVGFNNKKAINLADPTLAQDAATKNYVDTSIGGKVLDPAGVSNLAGNGRTLVWDQATNKWVTGIPNDTSKLPLSGGTMSGALDMGAQSVTNVGHVVIAAQGTLYLGKFTAAQEAALIALPLNNASDRGRSWYNVDTQKMRYWDGLAAHDVASKDYVDTTSAAAGTAAVAAAQTYADGKLVSKNLAVPAVGQDQQSIKWDNTAGTWVYFSPAAAVNNANVIAAIGYTPVNKAGDTMGGILTLSADPVGNMDAATKQYVVSSIATAGGSFITKDGLTPLIANWDIDGAAGSGFIISGLATPLAATDAVNKTYADAREAAAVASAKTYTDTEIAALDVTAQGYANTAESNAKTYADGKLATKNISVPAAPQDGQSVRWNNTSGNWEYFTASTSSGTVASVTSANIDIAVGGTATNPILTLNSGVGASQIVKLDASAKLPAVDGSALTNLNGSNIATGTVADARLSANVALKSYVDAADLKLITKNLAQPVAGDDLKVIRWNQTAGQFEYVTPTSGTVTGVSSANTDIGVGGTAAAPVLTLNSGVGASQIVKLDASAKLPAVDGSALTNLNATNVSSGTLADARLSANVAMKSYVDAADATRLPLAGGTMSGAIVLAADPVAALEPATKQYADAKLVSKSLAVPSGTEDGKSVRWNQTAGNWEYFTASVSSGTVSSVTSANSDASVATTTTTPVITINTGTAANQIVKLDASAKLPAVDASALTALNASNILSGTLADARLSSNVALKSYVDAADATAFLKDGTSNMAGNIKLNGNWLSNDGGNEGVFVATDGKVGIGTAAPFAGLNVSSNVVVGSPYGVLLNSRASLEIDRATENYLVQAVPGVNTAGMAIDASGYMMASQNGLKFKTGVTWNGDWFATGTEAMTMTTAGNVGIGVSNPGFPLEVNGEIASIGVNKGFRVGSTAGNNTNGAPWYGLGLANYGSAPGVVQVGGYAGVTIQTQSGLTHFATNGNVGFGTLGPTAALHLKAGTATGNTAPLKFTSGVNLTTPEAGAVEYDGVNLYFTDSGATRRAIATVGGSSYADGSTIKASAGTSAAPSLSFNGDSDTGLYSGAANTIGFTAGGTNIFNMSSSGLVSSTSGGASVSTAAGTATAPTFSFAGDTDTGWYSPAADTLAAATAGAERVRIDSAGNFGIGTIPRSKLDVGGGIDLAYNASNLASNAAGIRWQSGSAVTSAFGFGVTSGLFYQPSNDGTNPNFDFRGPTADGTVGALNVRIQPNGNIGVGTSAPSAKLEIAGLATNGLLKLNGGDGANNYTSAQVAFGWNGTPDYPNFIHTRHNAGTTNDNAFDFYTSDGTAAGVFPTNAVLGMSINGGKVGIGTTTPAAKLSIANGASSVSAVDIVSNSGTIGAAHTAMSLNMSSGQVNQNNTGLSILASAASEGAAKGIDINVNSRDGTYGVKVNATKNWGGNTGGIAAGVHATAETNSTAAISYGGYFNNTSTVGGLAYGVYANTATGSTDAASLVAAVGGVEKFRVDDSGNVGIGTSNPTAQLFIQNSVGTQVPLIVRDAGGQSVDITSWVRSDGAQIAQMKRTGLTIGSDAAFSSIAALRLQGETATPGAIIKDGGSSTSTILELRRSDDLMLASFSRNGHYLNGNVGLGVASTTAQLHVAAGSAAANTAPLKLTSGTVMTAPEAGAIEYDGTNLFFTDNTAARRTIATTSNVYVDGSTIKAAAGTSAAPSLSFNGDTDTGWYSPGANNLAASTGGSERIRIDGAGNIGIGTNLPLNYGGNYKILDVRGGTLSEGGMVSVANSDLSVQGMFAMSGAGPGISLKSMTNHPLFFGTNNVERMQIDASGNVGIGTSSPNMRAEIASPIADSAYNGLRLTNSSYTQDGFTSLDFFNSHASANFASSRIYSQIGGGGVASKLRFAVADSSKVLQDRLAIDVAGKVGIGTVTPAEKLDVAGGVKIGNTTGANAGTIRWTGVNFQGYDGSVWFNIVPNPIAASGCDSTQTFNTAGVHNYTVPATYATITIKVWGGGGAGGSGQNTGGGAGGSSTIASLGLTANGGGGGLQNWSGAGAGGTANGGSVNTSGASGTNASTGQNGSGGSSPNGGGGAAGNTALYVVGADGASPGGGGAGGGDYTDTSRGGGGGGGGYTLKTYTSATLPFGTNINDIIVGAGGTPGGGWRGGAGGSGQVSIVCSTTGTPPANNRGVLFLNAGAYTTDSNFVFDSSGRLGIGVASPTYQLELSTDSAAKPGTSTWTIASDVRLKDVQGSFTRGLNALEGIHPIYFNYKVGNPLGLPSDKTYVGIKAQDVKAVVPESVETDKKGFLHVSNDAIIWTMFNAIKELYHKWTDDSAEIHRELASVKEENAALKKTLSDLELRLQAIEQQSKAKPQQ